MIEKYLVKKIYKKVEGKFDYLGMRNYSYPASRVLSKGDSDPLVKHIAGIHGFNSLEAAKRKIKLVSGNENLTYEIIKVEVL